MSKEKMSEEELQKELERLYEIEDKQSEILKKQTGKGLYERVKIDGKGTVIVDSDDPIQKKVWELDEE